jgi:hypothetical protein
MSIEDDKYRRRGCEENNGNMPLTKVEGCLMASFLLGSGILLGIPTAAIIQQRMDCQELLHHPERPHNYDGFGSKEAKRLFCLDL